MLHFSKQGGLGGGGSCLALPVVISQRLDTYVAPNQEGGCGTDTKIIPRFPSIWEWPEGAAAPSDRSHRHFSGSLRIFMPAARGITCTLK